MEALKIVQSTQDGVLRIEVPEHFRNTELEVIVIPLHESRAGTVGEIQSIKKYFATARYPQTVTTKPDVYNQ